MHKNTYIDLITIKHPAIKQLEQILSTYLKRLSNIPFEQKSFKPANTLRNQIKNTIQSMYKINKSSRVARIHQRKVTNSYTPVFDKKK